MYTKARLKLTIFYSFMFFVLFWSLSTGLFFWFKQSLGEGYITKVKEIQQTDQQNVFDEQHRSVVITAGGLALNQLYDTLLFLNEILLIIIPICSWYLTGKTLNPIQRSNEKQRQFVSDASHELKTPLSIISGEMEIALKKTRSVGEYKKIIVSTKEEINRLSKLVQNLLFLAKNDYYGKQIVFLEADITDIINSVIHEFRNKILEKKLNVHLLPAKENLVVRGHESMLRTLFSNLLDNAIKYSRRKGDIWIKFKNTKYQAIISIKDNGVGISREEQDKIFGRFYRVDASRSESKGFGLGLAIARSIVESHKGKITISSSINKGATFQVYLPKKI
ncbi:hypothetical protein AUJ73_05235 [Candidatus Gottesmanbacteria bacterium CG1_02_37_22]|uniref:histidine kinase n=1 Tax=Candidatus Gottesmanbacteria bacterium CG1_02_37_22 TaxID=1805209 RepID=A0A1J4TNV0_9BACT|nr:MAG: hypothetical protein AUJ73_05235 [Candidatus Gottesmanbacteria bacterium CG1_02_37_22]